MLTSIFSSNDLTVKMPFTKLEESTECVDDVNSSHYNKILDKFKVGKYDWHSSEKMLAIGEQYELGVFVSHNPKRNKGDGSCIFLHIWSDVNSSTAGCTAMNKQNMEQIVSWLDSIKKPFLVQLPNYLYEHYKVALNLPLKQLK
jgi:D-alanyl-D-alanine dipeptidase